MTNKSETQVSNSEINAKESVPSVINSDDNLTRNFVEMVKRRVEEDLSSKRIRNIQIFTAIFSVLGIGIITIAGSIFNMQLSQMEQRLNNEIDAKLNGFRSSIETDINQTTKESTDRINNDITTFNENLDLRLGNNKNEIMAAIPSIVDEKFKSFEELREQLTKDAGAQYLFLVLSNEIRALESDPNSMEDNRRDAIIFNLEGVSKHPELLEKPEFIRLLESFIDRLAAANNDFHVDHLDDLFGDRMTKSNGIVWTLVQHYGEKLVGSEESADKWPADTVERFERYARAARELEIRSISMAVEMLVAFELSHRTKNEKNSTLFTEVRYWNDGDIYDVSSRIVQYGDVENWTNFPTREVMKIQDVTESFCTVYGAEISEHLLTAGVFDAGNEMISAMVEPFETNLISAFKMRECPQASQSLLANQPG